MLLPHTHVLRMRMAPLTRVRQFMLHWCTMMYGLLVEYISMPKATPDDNAYKNPVGDEQFRVWRERLRNREENPDEAKNMRFYTDYRRDPRALKLISQSEWEARRRASNATTGRPLTVPACAGRPPVRGGRALERARQGARRPAAQGAQRLPHRGAALQQLRPVRPHARARRRCSLTPAPLFAGACSRTPSAGSRWSRPG